MTENIIIITILLAVLCTASIYIVRVKKKGQKCIGCPNANNCKGGCK